MVKKRRGKLRANSYRGDFGVTEMWRLRCGSVLVTIDDILEVIRCRTYVRREMEIERWGT